MRFWAPWVRGTIRKRMSFPGVDAMCLLIRRWPKILACDKDGKGKGPARRSCEPLSVCRIINVTWARRVLTLLDSLCIRNSRAVPSHRFCVLRLDGSAAPFNRLIATTAAGGLGCPIILSLTTSATLYHPNVDLSASQHRRNDLLRKMLSNSGLYWTA